MQETYAYHTESEARAFVRACPFMANYEQFAPCLYVVTVYRGQA